MNIETVKTAVRGTVGMIAFFGTTIAVVGFIAKLITMAFDTDFASTWIGCYVTVVVGAIVWLNVSEKSTDHFLEVIGLFTEWSDKQNLES
jgi:uncharacterized membrane protein YdfJ with MMPL/SSD domain